jgi:hypothetical protein
VTQTDDNFGARSYDAIMAGEPPHIELHVDTKQPIELGDFVAGFTSISGQYDKFIRANFPDLEGESRIFIREVRAGSIEADLIPWAVKGLSAVINVMDQVLIVEQFVRTYGERLSGYFRGHPDPNASNSDLKDFMGGVAAIANDSDGKATLSAVAYEDGKKQIKAAIQFDTNQAREAAREIEKQRLELEKRGSADHQRVLMFFSQSNIKDTTVGKRTGERVVIESIQERDLPLIYASELAEQRIKHEIREADENVFKRGFVVDVNVATRGGRPVAYRVTDVHQVIDLE